MTLALADQARALDAPLSVGQRAVLVTMARLCDDRRLCWASNATIAEHASVSLRTVRYAKRKLEEMALIAWDESGLRTRRYHVLRSVKISAADRVRGQALPPGGQTVPPNLKLQDLPINGSGRDSNSDARATRRPPPRKRGFDESAAELDRWVEEHVTPGGQAPSSAGVEGVPPSVRAAVADADGRQSITGVESRAVGSDRRRRGKGAR